MPKFPSVRNWAVWPKIFFQTLSVISQHKSLDDALRAGGEAKVGEQAGLPMIVRDGVAVISISGYMEKDLSLFSFFFGGTSTREVRAAVELAAADESIKAIILQFDTPGGTVDGLAELGDAIFAAQKQKTVIAQVDGLLASAGYYAASQASEIYAHRMDEIGSIGIIAVLYDVSANFTTQGIEAVVLTTGPYKATGVPGAKVTDEQRAEIQKSVDAFFADFLAMIKRGRKIADKKLEEVSDGRIFLAADALELGLIDGIQTAEETFEKARKAANAGRDRTARALVRRMNMN